MFTRLIQVRFSECDGLGHVNNTQYLNYMEDARIDVFRLFNPSLSLDKWNLIVASTRCDFLAQVTYAQQLTVTTWIPRIGNSSFSVHHAIQDESGAWVARAEGSLIAYDYEKQCAMPIWEEARAALGEHAVGPLGVPDLRN
ncbi:acyl-CoA thioesterase [Alicyclobacillus fastidiosus]|uniref:Acyl-CoA thioesterase n=1 Tax=Alicyclobacillus fastidiosus TaxID=392011 RepID=A0ABY6ZJA0_9BACL|nr:thioesterase family protein [Alicyclobacillus fastidiosus]WAH43005.1 acyl-CoA thioesterase [Alicyclobacillus fastidiosus]GMA64975.1 thioesterase [Alicyclobacillus fastidiosus]